MNREKLYMNKEEKIINDNDVDNLVFDMRDTYVDDFINNEISDINELNDKKKKKLLNH